MTGGGATSCPVPTPVTVPTTDPGTPMATATIVVLGVVGIGATLALLATLVLATREVRATADRLAAVRDRVEPMADGIGRDARRGQARLEALRAERQADGR